MKSNGSLNSLISYCLNPWLCNSHTIFIGLMSFSVVFGLLFRRNRKSKFLFSPPCFIISRRIWRGQKILTKIFIRKIRFNLISAVLGKRLLPSMFAGFCRVSFPSWHMHILHYYFPNFSSWKTVRICGKHCQALERFPNENNFQFWK